MIDLLRAAVPGAEVDALEEGAAMSTKEVVLRIRARYSAFGLYETALLGMLASQSGWVIDCGAFASTRPASAAG